MKNQQRLIIGLVLSLVLVVFAILNGQAVEVNFFGAKASWPLILVIVGSVILGALITFLVSTSTASQMKKQIKQLQAERDDLAANKPDVDNAIKQAIKPYEQQVKDLQAQLAQAKKS
ncbi:LapA family protein [Lacticaseibacillus brantae]|uniref:Lipopolysaccharide assembly protein A domain-containing protein n=1 Tax=Lacticaseibacillus brantae DSM 23927 TaxID=1423727 RepID=A0A0R2B3Q2_9LACO|nr:lipopolysaccharide assembly protein LapA domain-containing protein [Lacticaseibacillus brantae]KRM72580.1 hypothetical protein FC34_GL000288 [Lacticaseibacillus brantae DSM 23927]